MGKRDPRAENGVRVARRMGDLGVTPGRKDSLDDALSKAAAALSDADRRRQIEAIYARNPGLRERVAAMNREHAMVKEMQRQGHASTDYATAVRQVRTAGQYLEQQQAQAAALSQLQAEAEGELLSFAQRLGPQDVAIVEQLFATGGWPAVTQALAEAGLSPGALEVATSTMVECRGDLAALGQRIAQQAQMSAAAAAEAQRNDAAFNEKVERMADFTRAAIERWSPQEADTPGLRKLKESSPLVRLLRNPEFHVAALEWLEPRAEQLRAAGLLRDGMSPGEAFLRLAQTAASEGGPARVANEGRSHAFAPEWSHEDALSALAQVVGADAQAVRAFVDEFHTLDAKHRAMAAAAESLDGERARRARPLPPDVQVAKAPERKGTDAKLSAALERAVKATGFAAEQRGPVRAESTMDAAIALAAREPFVLTSSGEKHAHRFVERVNAPKRGIDGAMERAAAHLEGRATPEREPSVGSDAASSDTGMSIDQAMAAADRHLNGGSTDE